MQSSATQYFNPIQNYPYSPKSLGLTATSSKALGTPLQQSAEHKNLGGDNLALAQWYENALPYWQAVQSGQIQISPEQYQQLQDWIQFAQTSLEGQSSVWGSMDDAESNLAAGQGAVQNSVYTDEQNEFTCDGSTPVSDVWGNTATMNVPPPCTVTFETTTDTRYNPPEEVVKAIVRNPAKRDSSGEASQSVVFFHDGVKITCNAAKKSDGTSRVQDLTGDVTVGDYHAPAAEGDGAESSIPGVEKDGKLVYEPDYDGDTVSFKSALGADGQTTTRVVWADTNISVKPSDQSDVTMDPSSKVVTVTVTHSNGSKDVYEIQKGYKVNINAHAVTYDGSETMPGELQDLVTINGGIDENGESSNTGSDIVDELMETTQCSETQLLHALHGADYNYQTIEEFKNAVRNHEFPGEINKKLLDFLSTLDTDLHDAVSSLGVTEDSEERKSLFADATQRIEELLTILSPDSIIHTEQVANNPEQWGEFSIDGNKYAWNYQASDPDGFCVSEQ